MTLNFEDDGSAAQACPYCGDIYICKHVALAVDLTFREIFGGFLEKNISEEVNKNSDSDEEAYEKNFDEYIRTLRSSKNFLEIDFEVAPMPGFGSSYAVFYSEKGEAY